MEQPPHPMRLGNDEKDYYVRDPKAPVDALAMARAGDTVEEQV
jgi:NADH-quinone oxidoreductase subunit I